MRVSIEDVTVRYGAHVALRGVSLAAEPGQVVALVGPNGSGKSTLMRAVAGLARHEGRIGLGAAPRGARHVGFMPQDIGPRVSLTVLEVVLLGRLASLALRVTREDVDAASALLGRLGVADLAPRMIGELSGGQRQLVFLAQVLAGDPAVLLLDEPTSALDLRNQLELLGLVRRLTRKKGLATIVSLHDLNVAARFADSIAVLCAGRLHATGAPGAVFTADMLRAVYGVEADVSADAGGLPVITAQRACVAAETKPAAARAAAG
ncbi:MAG: ABC transporter ATP-binding protein [Alphaproteobacteria bacterium]|nr:ABC transporter ATP-binding protein [Alphaproteobacteria bacterium]